MAKTFVFDAHWDAETGWWWAENQEIPVVTEAENFDALVERVVPIALEMIVENRCADPGDDVIIHVVAKSTTEIKLAAA
ncbi:MAG: DUF1902 domain-containing protein [Rhodospirillaceae bacterium]